MIYLSYFFLLIFHDSAMWHLWVIPLTLSPHSKGKERSPWAVGTGDVGLCGIHWGQHFIQAWSSLWRFLFFSSIFSLSSHLREKALDKHTVKSRCLSLNLWRREADLCAEPAELWWVTLQLRTVSRGFLTARDSSFPHKGPSKALACSLEWAYSMPFTINTSFLLLCLSPDAKITSGRNLALKSLQV